MFHQRLFTEQSQVLTKPVSELGRSLELHRGYTGVRGFLPLYRGEYLKALKHPSARWNHLLAIINMVLRIGYVKEHFASPLLQYAEKDAGKTFTLFECPKGTGELIRLLENDEIDVTIALTDPLLSGIANGCKAYKLVGSYVITPLNWAVATGVKSPYQKIEDLRGTTFGISREGSGSHTMPYIMALKYGWSREDIKVRTTGVIGDLIKSVNDGSTSAFMWDHFTTKPYEKDEKVRLIGIFPTPWASWHIAAHPERAQAEPLKKFIQELSNYVQVFDSEDSRSDKNVPYINAVFNHDPKDIQDWLKTVAYTKACEEVSEKTVLDTLSTLVKAGIVKPREGGFDASEFVNTGIAKLV